MEIEVGKTYLDSYNNIVNIIEKKNHLGMEGQYYYLGDNGLFYSIHGACYNSSILNFLLKEVTAEDRNINNPKHYNNGSIEAITVIEDWKLNFNLGNVIKYISRAGKKDPSKEKEDLEKALWYLKREIDKK